jgi:hypothetical protein
MLTMGGFGQEYFTVFICVHTQYETIYFHEQSSLICQMNVAIHRDERRSDMTRRIYGKRETY